MKVWCVPKLFLLGLVLFCGLLLFVSSADASTLTDKQLLGKLLFFDTNLSSPDGQACASCHDPKVGFADPDQGSPVSDGILPLRVGPRNSPTVTYLATVPDFAPVTGGFVGGLFWDSRAISLLEQAKLPFLNPIEMHNANKKQVVHDVEKAEYADLFKQVYPYKNIFKNTDLAYDCIADAIVAYEKSPELNKFNSKYDLYLQDKVELTGPEALGLELFEGKAQCFRCHVTTPNSEGGPPVFTSFRFSNIGVPKNPDNPFYSLIPSLNPDRANFVDLGLGGFLQSVGELPAVYEPQLGRMNFPTLRNIALTPPYMHNGVFSSLEEVVRFFNKRDALGFLPEVPLNVSTVIGNLELTPTEEEALVAFLRTLTDDYKVPNE